MTRPRPVRMPDVDARRHAHLAWMVLPPLVAAAVLLVAVAIGIALALLEWVRPSELWDRWGAFRSGFIATTVLGMAPALVFGTPAYALLQHAGRARWGAVIALGAGLGSLVALFDVAFLGWGVAAGAAVAGLTHIGATRWFRAGHAADGVVEKTPA